MLRFIRLTSLAVALTGVSSAAVISMTSSATFTGGLDLAINGADNDTSTRLIAGTFGPTSTMNFTTIGQVDWLALGTLQLGEGIAQGDTTPNIIAQEFANGYQLGIDVNTNIGLLSFIANSGLFNTINFDPGASDADTTDTPAEITVDFSSLNQSVTVGLLTYSLKIVDNVFSNNSTLAFNQNGTAATVWLRLEVTNVENPNAETAEVGTLAMLGSGLLAVGTLARRKASAQTPQMA